MAEYPLWQDKQTCRGMWTVPAAALLQNPGILAAGPSGTVYIVDGPYLRVMDASANVSTLYAALPSDITAMAVDDAGNAYMAEKLGGHQFAILAGGRNHRFRRV